MKLDIDYANRILGLRLTAKQVVKLLLKAGYGIDRLGADEVNVRIPCYRFDVMHPIDIVEDVAIAYDYDNVKPVWRETHTTGFVRPEQALVDLARELMIGLGFQETLNYTLTNLENLFTKMNVKKERIVEVSNPKVVTLTCLRNWVLPSLMEFVGNNLHVELPQKIFELGKVTLPDASCETKTRDEERLAGIIYSVGACFSEVKSALDAFFMNLGLEWEVKEGKHSSFIDGRVGMAVVNGLDVGIFGELNPEVLQAWKLENPASAFELNITEIFRIKQD
jgi:phenylalanyl-tRNA synthetase beta chain